MVLYESSLFFSLKDGQKLNRKLFKNHVKTIPKPPLNPLPKTLKLVINQ